MASPSRWRASTTRRSMCLSSPRRSSAPPWGGRRRVDRSTSKSTYSRSTWRSSLPTRAEIKFATIEEALEEIAAGKMVVVVDDEDRENEGDLVMAAQFITPDAVNFMTRQAGGW